MKEFWQNLREAAEASGEPERELGDRETASQSQTFRFPAGSLVVIKKQQLSDISPRTSVRVRCIVLTQPVCVGASDAPVLLNWAVLIPVAALVQFHVQGCCFRFFGLAIFHMLYHSSSSSQVSG